VVRFTELSVEAVEKPSLKNCEGTGKKNECVKCAILNDLGSGKGKETPGFFEGGLILQTR
jgi:hypothetical protein